MKILQVDSVSYAYTGSGIAAVKDVSFTLERGGYLAVLGTNGSGKSTLARLICGFMDPSAGTISFIRGTKTGIVFQSPNDQIVAGIVGSDTAFGPQNLGLNDFEVQRRTNESLAVTGLGSKIEEKTSTLSQGQKQKLAFSGILALQPDVLILDEAASMLDPVSRAEMLDFLDYWNSRGFSVIHITHDIDEARRAKQVIALEDGKLIFNGLQTEFRENTELLYRLFGDPLDSLAKTDSGDRNRQKTEADALVFDDISFSYDPAKPLFSGFSLSIEQGSLNALMGAAGCGKSTLLEIAAGLLTPVSGAVKSETRPALALQDSEHALFEEFAGDDVAYGPRNNGVSGKKLRDTVKAAMDATGLPFDRFADRYTFRLSGGEKRKLSLAGIIALDTPVMMFDEPTAGLDPVSRRAVIQILQKIAAAGKTVFFSTHREDEAAAADRVIRLANAQDGTVFLTGDTNGSSAAPGSGAKSPDNSSAAPGSTAKSPDGGEPAENVRIGTTLPEQPPLAGAKLLAFFANCGSIFSAGSRKNSFIQKLPAVAKYVVFGVLFITSFLMQTVFYSAAAIAVILLYAAAARYPLKKLFRSFGKILPWALLFFAFQLFFLPQGRGDTVYYASKLLTVTDTKLNAGAITILHLTAAFVSLAVFVYSITEREVLDGLEALLAPFALMRVPVRHLVLIVGIIFRFIPLLAEEAALIVKVQLIRGGLGQAKGLTGRIRMILPLVVPLIMRTLKRADILADALTARFYS